MDIQIKNQLKKQIPIKKWSWRTLLIYIVFYWIRIYHFLTGFKYTYSKKKKTDQEKIHEYTEKQKQAFYKTISSSSLSENANRNIEPVFYNKKEYLKMMEEENNEIETRWKTRMLLENTLRGNVLMFYDTYKQGFSYYSDMKTIPYDVLNTVAMKYTIVYRCRDFFMDETVFPESFVSPLIKIQEEEKKESTDEEEEKKREEKERIQELRKNPVFAKLKLYREIKVEKESAKEQSKDETEENKEKKDEKIWVVNKFIYLGKIANFSFLQKPKKKERESICINKKVSYKDFKSSSTSLFDSVSYPSEKSIRFF